jgi:YD repeat-containing protein
MTKSAFLIFVAVAGATASTAALAIETITYKYDERGRLKEVLRTGTVNNNVNTAYSYDRADNRTKKETKTGQ